MTQAVRNLFLELLDDINQPLRKVEPNIICFYLKYY